MYTTSHNYWRDPASEGASTFSFSSVAAMCGVLAVGEWNITLPFYPVYLFLANLVTAIVISVGQYQVYRLEGKFR